MPVTPRLARAPSGDSHTDGGSTVTEGEPLPALLSTAIPGFEGFGKQMSTLLMMEFTQVRSVH